MVERVVRRWGGKGVGVEKSVFLRDDGEKRAEWLCVVEVERV